MSRRALVLAAGMGARIRAVAGTTPKPLMKFAGKPVLAHTLLWLARSDVKEAWINLHYGADQIQRTIGDGSAFGLEIHYVYEPTLKRTAGALANIAAAFTAPMWVVYGDSFIRCNLAALAKTHERSAAELTLAVFDQTRHLHTGIAGGRVVLGASGAVLRFEEGAAALSPFVNAGVYLAEPAILDLIPNDRPSDFGREVFPAMLAASRPLAGHVIESDGMCLGLDTPESFARGQALLAEGAIPAP